MRGAAGLLTVLWLAAGWAAAGSRLRVLAFPERGGFSERGAWLVLEAADTPRVLQDGRELPVGTAREGVYHVRLGPARPGGSRVEVAVSGERIMLTLPDGRSGAPFHADPPGSCTRCHRFDACEQCHRWGKSRHADTVLGRCDRCHRPGEPPAPDPEALCTGCHAGFGRKHPKLRHPVRAPRDPRRPDRPLTCTSCHDPHAPRCLACLDRPSLRRWCRGCHGTGS